jgi:DNA repair exonuclease SbcCD ATPase subunit
VAKIRWSREFKEAKEAQITILREQTAVLERLSPPALLTWVEGLQNLAEKQVTALENQLIARETDLRETQENIERLKPDGAIRYDITREAEKQRDDARAALEQTKAELTQLREALESRDKAIAEAFPIRDLFASRSRMERLMRTLSKQIADAEGSQERTDPK